MIKSDSIHIYVTILGFTFYGDIIINLANIIIMNLATKTNVSVGSWHRNSIKRTDLQCSTTYGYLTTNIRMVPALLVMQTTLGITLCNNLQDMNLSIFKSVPQVIFEVHSVHDLVLPAVLFRCHYWRKCCLRRVFLML